MCWTCPQAVIVGTDIPDLSADIVHAALRALDDHDVSAPHVSDSTFPPYRKR